MELEPMPLSPEDGGEEEEEALDILVSPWTPSPPPPPPQQQTAPSLPPPPPPPLPLLQDAAKQRRRATPSTTERIRWTKDEDAKLTVLVREYGGRDWKGIASHFESRSHSQCLHRWQKVLDPRLVKGPWKPEEDAIIVSEWRRGNCEPNWTKVAILLPGRIGKQARERYYNHLHGGVRKDEFEEEENRVIVRHFCEHGSRWAEMSRMLVGRPDNAIKNHFNSYIRKKIDGHTGSFEEAWAALKAAEQRKLENAAKRKSSKSAAKAKAFAQVRKQERVAKQPALVAKELDSSLSAGLPLPPPPPPFSPVAFREWDFPPSTGGRMEEEEEELPMRSVYSPVPRTFSSPVEEEAHSSTLSCTDFFSFSSSSYHSPAPLLPNAAAAAVVATTRSSSSSSSRNNIMPKYEDFFSENEAPASTNFTPAHNHYSFHTPAAKRFFSM